MAFPFFLAPLEMGATGLKHTRGWGDGGDRFEAHAGLEEMRAEARMTGLKFRVAG